MKTLNRRDFPGAQYPERIIQFGEGNFLRAFVDWQIDLLNEHTDLNSGVVVVRPIETSFPPSLSTQEWALPEAFIQWLDQANSFCSTLVDRIVTGYPRDEVAKLEEELGYHDGFLDTACL